MRIAIPLGEYLPLQVERSESPSLEDFEKRYAQPGKPVLISGVVSKWPACSLWNANYFTSLAGERLIPVKRMQNGAYSNARVERMTLSDYLEAASKEPIGNERLYLSEEPVQSILPEITQDYCPPLYIRSNNILAVIYIGNNVHSQIHYHTRGRALLCQVMGRKRVKLFSPEQTPFLYQKLNFSKIEGEPVDLKKYPLYAKARYYECDVNPGEMLFFPICWWHGVETLSFSCSITFFWDEPWNLRCFPPRGIPLYYGSMFELISLAVRCGRFLKNLLSRFRNSNSINADVSSH